MSDAPLRGLVLAGGDSRRMGADKAGLQLDGTTMLERAVAQLLTLISDVHVSVRARDPLREQFNCIEDTVAVRGPAAGILSAHRHYPQCAWLVLACDMPGVDAGVLEQLLAARSSAHAATCWQGEDGQAEPLCAVYEPATLAAFLRAVAAGGSASPRDWLAQSEINLLSPPASGVLRSANTPEEWQQLRNGHD